MINKFLQIMSTTALSFCLTISAAYSMEPESKPEENKLMMVQPSHNLTQHEMYRQLVATNSKYYDDCARGLKTFQHQAVAFLEGEHRHIITSWVIESRFSHLQALDLSGYMISVETLSHLTNLTYLDTGSFEHSQFTLPLPPLPKLKYLSLILPESCVSDTNLKAYTTLTSLTLTRNPNITDEDIISLTNLTELGLWGNKKITNAALKFLTKLEFLSLMSNKKITDGGITHLINLTSLRLTFNKIITDEGIAPLTKLKTLIGGNNITAIGRAALPNLEK